MRNWWLRRSLRVRLTVWYAVTSTVILLALGGMVFFVVNRRLVDQLDSQLRGDFEAVEARVTVDSSGALDWQEDEHDQDEAGNQNGLWFEISSAAGSSLLHEGPSTDWKILSPIMHLDSGFQAFSAESERHLHVRVLENTTQIEGRSVLLRVFRSEAELRQALAELGAVLAVGLPTAVALSAAGGFFLARRSLSPVGEMAERAKQITADSLGGRLPVPNPYDELGQLAVVFNATLARLENSFSELRRFTADASHELRTPLTALQAVGEAALRPDSGDPKSLREALASMLEETRRLSDLVDALLLLARADTGRLSPSLDKVDLAMLLNEVRETLLVLAEEKSQRIEIKAEQRVIRADRELLRLALLNLVHNAIRYSGEGKVINLQVKSEEKTVLVEVVDQGPGIAPEHQQKVFERFYRVDKARSRASGGVGLGLSITRWAVERQGARIELESKPGRGSLFRIVIPVEEQTNVFLKNS
jgi:heavy metal sensor kinase